MVSISAGDAETINSGCDVPFPSGVSLALEVHGADVADKLEKLRDMLRDEGAMGSSDVALAVPAHDERLRGALFGAEGSRLASAANVAGTLADCACVLVLPTAVAKGQAGQIIDELVARLSAEDGGGRGGADRLAVTALATYDLDRRCAEEFLEVYRHVIPDFLDYTSELCAGTLFALEISGPSAVARVREIVGPRDVDVAKRIRWVRAN